MTRIKTDKFNKDGSKPKEGEHFLTIFSDASFKDGIYGTGFWFKNNGISYSGGTAGTCKNSEEAEILGILFALDSVLLKGFNLSKTIVVLQCDCVGALLKVDTSRLEARKVVKKHVKGHSSIDTKRTWIQSHCDRLALRNRRAYEA